ncbi:MAG: TetR/AcrR family transcriptional regulator [Lachnospiraceae bacterium]|nr:TetR/AcrR family transcriptional regulator [Lachnospiraceae bacterium]
MPNFTQNAIKQAFIKLLEEKPYNEITIKDIVTECGINRNSFYYHFQDMPSLLEEIIKESLDNIIIQYPSFSSLEDCMSATIAFAESYKRAILHIYRSVDRGIFERYLWQACDYAVNKYCENVFLDQHINKEDEIIIFQYYKCECFGQMMAWMENGMKNDIKKDIQRLCVLKQGQVEEMIERSKNQ